MSTWDAVKDGLSIFGAAGLVSLVGKVIIDKVFYKRRDSADLSKIEKEAGKTAVEKYLVELNVNDIIQKKCEQIEEKYKNVIFEMQREHYEIKKDIQGRLEKEMKIRIEAEQENEILKNELHLIRQKSDDQDVKIDELNKKVKDLEKK